jgi:hypothetical protein
MSEVTNNLLAEVVKAIDQLEQDIIAVQDENDQLIKQFQSVNSAWARDEKLIQLLISANYFMGYTPKIDYVFGGESLTGMDCSGFMQTLYKEIGIKLPRVSADQIKVGQSIPIGQELPGDLLGFNLNSRNGAGIEHIGMCIGNGLMIHTAVKGEGICISDYKKRYGDTFTNVVRVF